MNERSDKRNDDSARSRSKNVTWHDSSVTRENREDRRGHRGAVLWFTGLSASGKSTLAVEVERALFRGGYFSYVLDGDNVRHGLNGDLGFTAEDRTENIRRIGEVAKLFSESGALCLTAFISPYREDRERVRDLMTRSGDFVEVFVSCPVEVCEERDPKGLYKKARAGEIPNFTGIDAPYEAPQTPEVVVETNVHDVATCVEQVLDYLREHGYISSESRLRAVSG